MACKPNSDFAADNEVDINGVTYIMHKPDDVLGYGDLMTIDLELKG
jgi:hypothetical protein